MHLRYTYTGCMSEGRVTKAYVYRLYPTCPQSDRLTGMLADHAELYNAALQERRDAYRTAGVTVKAAGQMAQLTAIRQARPDQAVWSFTSQQQTLRRLDKAFAAFFRRVKSGEAPGYPRFRSARRFDSVDFRHGDGIKLDASKSSPGHATLRVQGVGTMKVRMHRAIPDGVTLGQVTVKRQGRRWYVVLPVEMDATPLPVTGKSIGGDLGVAHLLTLSEPVEGLTDAEGHIAHPRHLRRTAAQLADAQQSLSRKRRGSMRRRKAVARVAELHGKVQRGRMDTAHKTARKLAEAADVLVFEDLRIANLIRRPKPKPDPDLPGQFLPNRAAQKAGLNKSILDAGWGVLISLVQAKAEDAGRVVVLVNPANTSRTCSGCGHILKSLTLADREYICPACGTVLDRDVNAAINILRAGTARHQASA